MGFLDEVKHKNKAEWFSMLNVLQSEGGEIFIPVETMEALTGENPEELIQFGGREYSLYQADKLNNQFNFPDLNAYLIWLDDEINAQIQHEQKQEDAKTRNKLLFFVGAVVWSIFIYNTNGETLKAFTTLFWVIYIIRLLFFGSGNRGNRHDGGSSFFFFWWS